MSLAKPILAIALFAFLLLAASSYDVEASPSHSFQFALDSGFRISTFGGSVYSYRYRVSENWAFRLGLSGRSTIYDNQLKYLTALYPTNVYDYEITEWLKSWSYELMILHSHHRSDISLFYGAGPVGSIHEYEDSYWSIRQSWPDDEIFLDTSQGYSLYETIGVLVCFGIEKQLWSWLSIHAEYLLSARFVTNKHTTIYETDLWGVGRRWTTEEAGWHFKQEDLRFGLSLHF